MGDRERVMKGKVAGESVGVLAGFWRGNREGRKTLAPGRIGVEQGRGRAVREGDWREIERSGGERVGGREAGVQGSASPGERGKCRWERKKKEEEREKKNEINKK